ncbi:MAG TPA: hypothetical protein VFH27_02605, partial [Longimicrobiaceae bacterium]|nr:hypothetical protein [Longimicrobiaceae bacterium]
MSEWRLTLFRDDDETPLRGTVNPDGSVAEATCTTEAGQPFPYLMAPDSFAESEVDLAEGHSVIGQVNVRVLDVRTGADQATGWLTALLSADGYSALNGRRALVEQRDAASDTWFLLMDGIVGGVSLQEDYVTYALELRDIRERERKVKAFVNSDTSTIFPRGVLGGYGRQQVHVRIDGQELQHFNRWLIAPTVPVRGVYHVKESTWGVVDLRGLWKKNRVPPYLVVTKKMRDVLKPESRVVSGSHSFFRRYELTYPQARILWRRQGTQGWTEIRAPQRVAWNKKGMIDTGRAYTEDDGPSLRAAKFLTLGSIDPTELPQNGWAVEVVIGYNGPPSADYPLHLEGMTAGELLRDLYDGRYSPGQPDLGVRYDEAALLKLDTPVRARLTEPADDLRKWVEENVYRPLGAAPALDERGRISPIRYALPSGMDPDELLELNDENTAPDATWEHSAGDAVNHVVVTYARDYRVEEEDDPEGEVGRGDGLAELETTIEHVNIDSMALLGEKKLELELKLFRAVGGDDGSPVGGDVSDDTGFLLAQERAAQALDRFVFGAQSITAKCTRASTHALRVGDWVIAGMSWLPDYGSGRRGSNRLAQVVSIKDLDPAWREVRLVDAGPRMQPVPMPTPVVLDPDDTGAIPVQVLGIEAGTEAVVEFAVVSFDALGNPIA